ncbi:MAG: Omp28 family outer membrane lipoprotein [Bacteroidia bacterium]|jgi:thiol-disulfide isomerase/thioredoxin|nr:Omp28 family outer membrane lipoprotein [Bacteroidia bacterium]
MKAHRINIILTCIAGLWLNTSCDKINTPIQSPQTPSDTNVFVRKVLLEDYTGHTCGNCPNAAKVAESLSEQYGENLVVLAVHAGFFAKVKLPNYPASYTTTAGNDWDATSGFGVSNVGNPNGMVNRKNYENNGLIQKETKWPTTVALAINDTYILGLKLKLNYNASTRTLNTNVKANFKIGYSNNVKVNLVLTEDSIIGDQTDYTKSPDHIPDYVFMHVLRGAINGSWGTDLKNAPINASDSVSVDFNNFVIDSKFKDKQLTVVAFAYDALTKEVLQVEKMKLLSNSVSK